MGEAQTSVLLEDWEIDAIGEILNIRDRKSVV